MAQTRRISADASSRFAVEPWTARDVGVGVLCVTQPQRYWLDGLKASDRGGAGRGSTGVAAAEQVSTVSAGVVDAGTFATAEVALVGSVLEASTEYSIVAIDSGGRIVSWNEGARRLHGYERAEIIGEPELGVAHRGGRPRWAAAAAGRAGASRWGVGGQSIELRRKDGSHFTARVVKTLRRDAQNQSNSFLLIVSDVTDQVRLSGALARTRTFAESLLESAPDAMVIVNRDGEIQLANAETERLFGYAREELVGRPVEMLIPIRYHARHPEHRAGFFAAPRARPMGAGLELAGGARTGGVPGRDQPQPVGDRGGAAGDGRDPRRHRAQARRAGAP